MGSAKPATLELAVRVVPNASRTEVAGWQEDVLRVRLNAPPVDGKANKVLLKFLAKQLGRRPRDIEILGGETSRTKRLRIQDAPPDWRERLQAN